MHKFCLVLFLSLSMSIECMIPDQNEYDQDTYNLLKNELELYDTLHGLPPHIQGIPSLDQANMLQEVFSHWVLNTKSIKNIMNNNQKSLKFLHKTTIKNVLPLKELMQEGFKNYKDLKALSIFLNNNSFRMTAENLIMLRKTMEMAASHLYAGLQTNHDMRNFHQKWCLDQASEIGLDHQSMIPNQNEYDYEVYNALESVFNSDHVLHSQEKFKAWILGNKIKEDTETDMIAIFECLAQCKYHLKVLPPEQVVQNGFTAIKKAKAIDTFLKDHSHYMDDETRFYQEYTNESTDAAFKGLKLVTCLIEASKVGLN